MTVAMTRHEGALASFELLPEAVIVVDAAGTVVYANAMSGRLLGTPAGELAGKPAREVVSLWTEDGEDWWAFGRALEGDARLAPRTPEIDL
jgi:PAS domain S-box-containing protein